MGVIFRKTVAILGCLLCLLRLWSNRQLLNLIALYAFFLFPFFSFFFAAVEARMLLLRKRAAAETVRRPPNSAPGASLGTEREHVPSFLLAGRLPEGYRNCDYEE
jgi:hypothetical protein